MAPSKIIVITLGTSVTIRRYCSDTRVPVEPTEDIVMAPVYQWSTRVPLQPPGDT